MHSAVGSVAAGEILPVDVLMKSEPGRHREHGRAPDLVVGAELAGLEDRLEVRGAARLLGRDDLVERLLVATGEERGPVEHDVDLVGAVGDGAPDLGEPEVEVREPGRERAADARDLARRCRRPRPRRRATSVG